VVRKVLMTLVAAALCAIPAAAKSTPEPLPPDEAAAAATAVAPAFAPTVRRISASEVYAHARQPGAVIEVAPGLSLAQAVGLADPPRRLSRRATSLWCWSGNVPQEWGYWPYDLWVHDYTEWCGYYGGALTYRSTFVTARSTLCSSGDTFNVRLVGGVGYTFVAWRDGASFTCQTAVPWISVHYQHTIDLSANTFGAYYIYATG
jgi:hypothetical protein